MTKRTSEIAGKDMALNRRGLLKGLTTGAAGAATVVVAGVAAVEPAEAAESDAEKRKARYRVSEHVKTFYRTNRY